MDIWESLLVLSSPGCVQAGDFPSLQVAPRSPSRGLDLLPDATVTAQAVCPHPLGPRFG